MTITGSVTVSVPVEEAFETYGQPAGSAPWYNLIPDAPPWTGIRFFWVQRAGNIVVSGSVSVAGLTFDLSQVTPASPGAEVFEYISVSARAVAEATSFYGGTSSANATADYVSNADVETASVSRSGSGTGFTGTGAASVSGSSISATASISSYGSSYMYIISQGNLGARPRKPVALSGVVRAMERSYPDELTFGVGGIPGTLVTTGSGSFNLSGVQHSYSAGADVEASPPFPTGHASTGKSTFGSMTCAITMPSLEENGDCDRANRMLMRGWAFNGLNITQAGEYIIDNGSAINVTTGNHKGEWQGATGVSSGHIVGANGGNLVREFRPLLSCLSYRYLRVTGRVVGASNVLLAASIPAVDDDPEAYKAELGPSATELIDVRESDETPDKSWQYRTGADGATWTWDIDLCAPHNITDGVDDQQDRGPAPNRMPRYYGVWRARTIELSGVPGGAHLEIDSLSFVLKEGVAYDCVPTFYPHRGRVFNTKFELSGPDGDWPPEAMSRPTEILDSGTVVEYWSRLFLRGRADGRQTVEESDLGYTKTLTSSGVLTWGFSMPSIAAIAGAINSSAPATAPDTGSILTYPGITASITAPTPDSSENLVGGYLNSSLPAVYLGGGGAIIGGSSGWSYAFDLGGSIGAQTLYDEVDFYPGCNPFGMGTGAVACAGILRASAHGIVIGDQNGSSAGDVDYHIPLAGDRAEHREAAVPPAVLGLLVGTGESNSQGYYQTSSGVMARVPWTPGVPGSDPPEGAETVDTVIMHAEGATPARSITVKTWNRRRHRLAFLGGVAPLSSPCGRLLTTSNILIPFDSDAAASLVNALPFPEWRLAMARRNDEEPSMP